MIFSPWLQRRKAFFNTLAGKPKPFNHPNQAFNNQTHQHQIGANHPQQPWHTADTIRINLYVFCAFEIDPLMKLGNRRNFFSPSNARCVYPAPLFEPSGPKTPQGATNPLRAKLMSDGLAGIGHGAGLDPVQKITPPIADGSGGNLDELRSAAA